MLCCVASSRALLPRLPGRLAGRLGRHGIEAARQVHAAAQQQQQQQQQQAAAAAAAVPPPAATPPAAAPPPPVVLSVVAASPTATQLLAAYFACELHASDCYLLHGSVGAGKSYFSRAFIRAAADDEQLPVPSPTFLLQNMYTDHEGPPIHHFDLYRLQGGAPDLARLDLPASFAQAVCLVEWPERLAAAAAAAAAASAGGNGRGVPQPREPLEVRISILSPEEQAALAARLQAEAAAAQQRHAAGGAAEAGPGGGSGSEDEEEESGGDARWRRIQLAAAGARWRPRLQLLRRYLAEEGAALGCHLEPQGGEPA